MMNVFKNVEIKIMQTIKFGILLLIHLCLTVLCVQAKVISYVDTSLDGSQKYVLRVDGKPFYMTNIQIRLDKLYGYIGYLDEALEAAVKRAADDGFNTVSIPIHWREVEPEKNVFDWTILDKYLGWCKKYGLKMELLWFSWSSGGRVQWLVTKQSVRTPDYVCSTSGTSEYNVLRSKWEYSLDWRDANLRNRETYVLGKVMEHVAGWDANNDYPHTVIGVQLGNEARSHGANTATDAEIIDYYHEVGSAVKMSKYVVWTRLNCVTSETAGRIRANERKREAGGTNIDFVGIDTYGATPAKVMGNHDNQMPDVGKNYPMIMECGAENSNIAILQMAALAGNKAFDYYDLASTDGHALYDRDGTALIPHGTYIEDIRTVNKILNLANQDIALKAHGNGLYVYNYAGNSTIAETGIDSIAFIPDIAHSQAITIRHSSTEIVFLTTCGGKFRYPSGLGIVSASKGYFNEENEWMDEEKVDFTGTSIVVPAATAVRVIHLGII
jgi:hypothetical protein